ncbi:Ribonuclease T2 precursor (RNase T2) [Coniosporium tulheliwenetii]|uniref:Ribonuclease T2 (RNase T2) n=1 Tax=Coniosporium tulheliwenetii TaxID=3383036 RepID=A0ACC2YQQ0_9PEZI|nr:Ribonuclease T2 precursor (RNase T2) [Cladosporium sp. JES 115]
MVSFRHVLLASSAFLTLTSATNPRPHDTSVCSRQDLKVLSCTPAALTANDRCVESPSGLLLLTQLWNSDPGLGPPDRWTIHGLWPDYCNGSYPVSCDTSRAYSNIIEILEGYGQSRLLNYMRKLWRNDPAITLTNGTDADLWYHEWEKHGTCMSTLRPSCYRSYTSAREAVDYFAQTVFLDRRLPTYDYLAECGIVPSNSSTYARAALEGCVRDANGEGCRMCIVVDREC